MKKRYIIPIAIIAIYFIVFFFALGGTNKLKKDRQVATLLVGDNTVFTLKKQSWETVTDADALAKLDWTKFRVYVSNEDYGENYVWHDDKWYIFNDKREAKNYIGRFVAYQANYDMPIKKFTTKENTNLGVVQEVLQANSLDPNSEFTVNEVISVDYDNDGITENFYLISNAFPFDFIPNKTFTIVFMEKNKAITYLYSSIQETGDFTGCKPYISGIIDTNSDNVYEIIFSCGRYSAEEELNILYEYKNGIFKIDASN